MQGGGGWGPPGGPPPGGYGAPPPGGGGYAPPPAGGYGAPPPGGYGAPHGHAPMQPGFGPPPPGFAPPGFGPQPFVSYATSCPRCRSPHVHQPSFTWWGGLLGPKLFNHTVCSGCGLGYNWKTGKSNGAAIGIYLGVAFALTIFLLVLRIAAG